VPALVPNPQWHTYRGGTLSSVRPSAFRLSPATRKGLIAAAWSIKTALPGFRLHRCLDSAGNDFVAKFSGFLLRVGRELADIENVVGIKDIAPGPDIQMARILCDDRIVVSDSWEENWLLNLTVKGQEAMIATPEPFCLQSKKLRLLKEYTSLAMQGEITRAWEVCKRLEPIRRALKRVTFPGKVQASYKYWSQLIGMVGGDGRVRKPQLELSPAEKQAIEAAVRGTGLI